jgi:hypothetical protein
MDLKRAISMHLDPLDGYDAGAYSTEERIEFTKYVANHSISLDAEPLSEKEIEYLHRFLETLEFEIDEK